MLTIVDSIHDRQRDQIKRALLQRHPLLARCPPRVIRRVASLADEVTFAPGDLLAEQGRSPEWFFLLESGIAEVVRDDETLGVVGSGEYYGEVPLVGRGMHPATVRAITPMRAWVIGCQRFLPLVQDVQLIRDELHASLARQADLVAVAKAERAKRIRALPCTSSSSRPWASRPSLVRLPGRSFRPRFVTEPPPPPRRALRAGAVAAAVAVLAGFAALYHPPYAVIRTGPVIDVSHDIVIAGAPAHPPHGRYLLLTVRAERPSLLGLARAAVGGETTIEHVTPASPSAAASTRDRLHAEFTQSQRDATAAAATALGIPADRVPFTAHFRHRDVVGPSAGLVYALAIDDLLTGADHARGRVIAATGVVDPKGDVGPVAYVREKTIGARRAGAQLLLTPTSDAYEAAGAGLPVIGVSSVAEALSRLAAP